MSNVKDVDRDEELLMYLLVRKDLKMSAGKAIAQCGHAVLRLGHQAPSSLMQRYLSDGEAKIALKVPDLEALEQVRDACAAANVNYYVVVDQGRTQIPEGSITVSVRFAAKRRHH